MHAHGSPNKPDAFFPPLPTGLFPSPLCNDCSFGWLERYTWLFSWSDSCTYSEPPLYAQAFSDGDAATVELLELLELLNRRSRAHADEHDDMESEQRSLLDGKGSPTRLPDDDDDGGGELLGRAGSRPDGGRRQYRNVYYLFSLAPPILLALFVLYTFRSAMAAELVSFSRWVHRHGAVGAACYAAFFVAWMVCCGPSTPIELLGGFVYAGQGGSLALAVGLNTLGKQAGSVLCFYLARRWLRARVEAWLGRHFRDGKMQRLDSLLQSDAVRGVCMSRLLYVPFALKNYGVAAMTGVAFGGEMRPALLVLLLVLTAARRPVVALSPPVGSPLSRSLRLCDRGVHRRLAVHGDAVPGGRAAALAGGLPERERAPGLGGRGGDGRGRGDAAVCDVARWQAAAITVVRTTI